MSTVSSIPGYLSADEAAKIIGVDHSQVCRYCQDGRLPARKIGNYWMIREADVKKFKRPPIGNPNLLKGL